MKSLETIQKTFRVFQTLTRIGMILSFIWAGMAALGLLCSILWYFGGSATGTGQQLLHTLTVTGGLSEMIGTLLTDTILALTDGTLLIFALRYFKAEQAAGTPFTMRGADQIKHLGIRTIVLPLVAAILAAIVYEIFDLPQSAAGDWDNLSSLAMGIVLILASLVFRYGAELEERNALIPAEPQS